MTIILNISAIILIVFIGGITYLLNYISPDFTNIEHPYFWVVSYVICGIAEIVKLRGRIFFIPMWLIGVIGFINFSIQEYEKTGLLNGLVLSICIFIAGYLIMHFMNKNRWAKAQNALSELKNLKYKNDTNLYPKLLKDSFYIPNYLNSDNFLQQYIIEKLFDLGYKGIFFNKGANKHYQDFVEVLSENISDEDYNKYVAIFYRSLKKIENNEQAFVKQFMFDNIKMLVSTEDNFVRN